MVVNLVTSLCRPTLGVCVVYTKSFADIAFWTGIWYNKLMALIGFAWVRWLSWRVALAGCACSWGAAPPPARATRP